MQVITFCEAGNKLKAVLDRVVNDADYTITRRDAEDAVIMSLDHFNGLIDKLRYCLKAIAQS